MKSIGILNSTVEQVEEMEEGRKGGREEGGREENTSEDGFKKIGKFNDYSQIFFKKKAIPAFQTKNYHLSHSHPSHNPAPLSPLNKPYAQLSPLYSPLAARPYHARPKTF